MLTVAWLASVGWASSTGVDDDPWAAWRAPARILSGRVQAVVRKEGLIQIEIADEGTPPETTTVSYPQGFSFSFTPPQQGDRIMVSVVTHARHSRLAVQALVQSASTPHGLVLLDEHRWPVAAVRCASGLEGARMPEPLVPIAPDAPRVPASENDVLLGQALPWTDGIVLVRHCVR